MATLGPVELAAGDRSGQVFAALAASRGVTVRMCVAAAQSDRLADVVRLPLVEGYEHRGRRTLTGAQALSSLQAMRASWDELGRAGTSKADVRASTSPPGPTIGRDGEPRADARGSRHS